MADSGNELLTAKNVTAGEAVLYQTLSDEMRLTDESVAQSEYNSMIRKTVVYQ